ncbi:MAG: efflux RND transporter periplasmic adaptor subunit [Candidatus Eremiobacteraeota bacterium]|nr:efflux RND transporter periplasmic adaptor subunit [Candidatus Eremiobacteraeota bacterium]
MRPPFIALSAAAALVLGGCAARAATTATAPAATPVTLATASAPETRAEYAGPGTVAPQHVYRIAFEIPGRVVAVNADIGDRVETGAVLAAIDASDYAAQARAADARSLEADAAAVKARNGARAQERVAADQAVEAARAQLDRALAVQRLAAANRARFDSLYASGDVAASQHDQTVASARDADAAVDAARAQLAQAQAQRALVHDGTRSEDLAASAAEASAARANADLARVTLGKTSIVAPAAAYVEQRNLEPGSDAQPGAPAFVLIDARDPDVLVAVPEARLDGIAPGTPARVRADARDYLGTVTRIEPNADAASRTAQVRVRVPNLRARSGAVVDVALGTTHGGGDASVPLAAVVTDAAGATSVLVYDAAARTATRRTVHVVAGDSDRALVAGLAPGTRVVRAGAALVKPGAPLTVVPE